MVRGAVQAPALQGYGVHMPIRKVKQWLSPRRRRSAGQRRFEASLERLAQRDVTETVAEAEVQAWLALLEQGGAPPAAGAHAAPSRDATEPSTGSTGGRRRGED